MSILIDSLPTSLVIDEVEYKINSDFKACIRIMSAFDDPELAWAEKTIIMYENLYIDKPVDFEQAILQGTIFLNMGKEVEESEISLPKYYAFEHDANLIYSAFYQTHSIDLQTTSLHWWKFMALFMDLGSDTGFCSMVNLRKRLNDGTATNEERAMARDMSDVVYLPDTTSLSLEDLETEQAFMDALGLGSS